MVSTGNSSQSSRGPLGCGGTLQEPDRHPGHAADKSSAAVCSFHANMDHHLRGLVPVPGQIYTVKI